MLSVGVHEIFSLVPLLSFHHQLRHLQYLLLLNAVPLIPPNMIHVQLVSLPVLTRPDAVEITDQDCLVTLCDTRLVGN